jgi:hydroxyacylglutathione hydrolase
MKVKLKTVKSEGLAHNSYFLYDGGEAAVIDPRRDYEIYTQIASEECAQIKYILETHRNEDYVVGSLELKNMTEAEIAHSSALAFKYGEHNLQDGDVLNVGGAKIKALCTPGHTNDSLCYVVASGSSEPLMVFSGDTLFAGSVGRTDLYGKHEQTVQSEKLYNSLHEKILPLGDGVLVYPAHGQGSICGHGISNQEPTTIGYEKQTNPYLQLDKSQFIEKCLSEEFVVPRYFKQMEDLNLNGPPLLSDLAYPKALPLADFEWEKEQHNMIVLDTRMPNAYAGSHIPNSLSIWLGGCSVYPGWLLDINQYIIFIHERPSDIDTAVPYLRRLGFDNMCGFLCGGITSWQEAGKPISNYSTISVMELKEKLAKDEVLLLDVREPNEWKEDGVIDGAKLIFFSELPDKADTLPKDKPIAVTCSVGKRASIALSLLEQKGFPIISNVLGGVDAWTNLGYPVKKTT